MCRPMQLCHSCTGGGGAAISSGSHARFDGRPARGIRQCDRGADGRDAIVGLGTQKGDDDDDDDDDDAERRFCGSERKLH